MPRRAQVKEDTWFIRDSETEPSNKNMLLSGYVGGGSWTKYNILRIDRIEIGDSGWLVTYRLKAQQRSSGSSPRS